MKLLHFRNQQTIAKSVTVTGIGYLTGEDITVRFTPASENSGISFVRTDVRNTPIIPATVEQVTDTNRRTTIGELPNGVTMVEHVMAALAGLRVDNCVVEVNNIEPPGLDGSSKEYVVALQEAGCEIQNAKRAVWTVDERIIVDKPGATLAIHPACHDELKMSYFLDYGLDSPIMMQRATEQISVATFATALADCRTYLTESEALNLQAKGVGRRTNITDLVVFGRRGPIGNRLRYADEPARHKILDLVGDLSLIGADIRGHVVAYRSGHPMNIELSKRLKKEIQKSERSRQIAA